MALKSGNKSANPQKKKYLNLAKQAEKNEEYKDALDYYDKALHIDRNDLEIWTLKGKLCTSVDQFSNAINCFDQALNLDPENFDAVFHKARALERNGDLDEALQQYSRAIRLDGTNYHPYLLRGKLLGKTGRKKEALESLEQSIRHDPKQASAWFYKAVYHQDMKQYMEALNAYDRAIAISPESFNMFMARGKLRAVLSQHDVAMDDFNAAKKLDRESPEPYYHEALVLDLAGKGKGSKEALIEGVRLAGSSDADNVFAAKLHFQLALLYESEGLGLQAYQHVTNAMNLDGSNVNYGNYRQILSSEYHSALLGPFLISLLDELLRKDNHRVRPALKALLEKGDSRTLEPVLATLYDPDLIWARLLEVLPGVNESSPEKSRIESFRRKSKPVLDPWKLKADIINELNRVKTEYYIDKNNSGLNEKMGNILNDIKNCMEGDEIKELPATIEEFSQLMKLQPMEGLLDLLLYLTVIMGGNYVLLADYTTQPHLLDLALNPEHVKRSLFSRFSINTTAFRETAKRAFKKPRKKLIDEARALIEKDMIRSISKTRKNDTWLTFQGGEDRC
ncbi:MAG: tetratricopeptide repeat protein [Candidatus Thermoplasmatota archaeon]|jgi:tetratricopeptide (TPR) repeat protein|nr:tetratricopeptide repeat protein [Candidatus Thermoplasmatota archaeon]